LGKETAKGIGKVKTGLVISAVVIVVLAGLNIWFHRNKQSLELTYNNYVATHSYTNAEHDSLNITYQNYMATHGYTNTEYWDLYANYTYENWWHHYYKNLTAAKLIKMGMHWTDNRPWFGTPYVRVTGYIVNVGIEIAYDCEVAVKLYRDGVLVATQIIYFGDIHGRDWWCDRYIDQNFYYPGPPITSVTIIPSWNIEP